MTLNLDNFMPDATIIDSLDTLKKVLDFVTKIKNSYNTSRFSYGCFYTNWLTDSGNTESVIGREQMFEFITKLHSGHNHFSRTVLIYNEIYKLQRIRDDYKQRGLGHCCNYDATIIKLRQKLDVDFIKSFNHAFFCIFSMPICDPIAGAICTCSIGGGLY